MNKSNLIKISAQKWKELIIRIITIIDIGSEVSLKIASEISKENLLDNLNITIQDNGHLLFILINNLEFEFHKNDYELFDAVWVHGLCEIEIGFNTCKFTRCGTRDLNLPIKINSRDTTNKDYSIVSFRKCEARNISIGIQGSDFVSLSESQFDTIEDLNSNTHLSISKCDISYLKISRELMDLNITNSKLGRINIDHIIIDNSLSGFNFDENSTISDNAEQSYRKLQILVKKEILSNQIQSHILFVKELKEYSRSYKSFDDFLLYWINNLVNKHGRSIIRPVIWMLMTNTIFFGYLNYSNTPNFIYNKQIVSSITKETIVMSLNISPLHEFESLINSRQKTVDSLRRVLLTFFYYSLISAGLRFKFKKN